MKRKVHDAPVEGTIPKERIEAAVRKVKASRRSQEAIEEASVRYSKALKRLARR